MLCLWHRRSGLSNYLRFQVPIMAPHRCQYCGKGFKTPRAVNHHISASKSCSRDWRNDLYRKEDPTPSPLPKRLKKDSLTEFDGELDQPNGLGDDFVMPSPTRGVSVEDEEHEDGGRNTNLKGESEQNERFIESFPGEAGKGLRKSKTQFEVWLENQKKRGKNSMVPVRERTGMGFSQMATKERGPVVDGRIPKTSNRKKNFLALSA